MRSAVPSRRSIRGALAPAAFATLVSAACSSTEGAPTWAGTVDTLPSGMVVVTNPARGLWDSSAAWRVGPEIRLGALDGDGPELFGRIGAVEVDGAGRLWVLDTQAQEIRVFDAQGEYVRTVGRKGGGPGEFTQAIGMA